MGETIYKSLSYLVQTVKAWACVVEFEQRSGDNKLFSKVLVVLKHFRPGGMRGNTHL